MQGGAVLIDVDDEPAQEQPEYVAGVRLVERYPPVNMQPSFMPWMLMALQFLFLGMYLDMKTGRDPYYTRYEAWKVVKNNPDHCNCSAVEIQEIMDARPRRAFIDFAEGYILVLPLIVLFFKMAMYLSDSMHRNRLAVENIEQQRLVLGRAADNAEAREAEQALMRDHHQSIWFINEALWWFATPFLAATKLAFDHGDYFWWTLVFAPWVCLSLHYASAGLSLGVMWWRDQRGVRAERNRQQQQIYDIAIERERQQRAAANNAPHEARGRFVDDDFADGRHGARHLEYWAQIRDWAARLMAPRRMPPLVPLVENRPEDLFGL
jgi:hypothetical protein